MKITKINASFSVKKQIRQFEPIEVFMAAEAEVDMEQKDIDLSLCQTQLFEIVKAGVDAEIEKLMNKPKEQSNTREAF